MTGPVLSLGLESRIASFFASAPRDTPWDKMHSQIHRGKGEDNCIMRFGEDSCCWGRQRVAIFGGRHVTAFRIAASLRAGDTEPGVTAIQPFAAESGVGSASSTESRRVLAARSVYGCPWKYISSASASLRDR